MNVIGYTRVSTDNQAKEDKFGLEVQKEQIAAYCEARGMNILRWVTDAGESGAKERPGFDEIVYGEVSNPPVEAVVVAKTDRVARDINVYYYYKMLLKKKEIALISIAEDFGQMGAFAPFLEAFTLCVAQMERDNITKRTSAGRRAKATTGSYSGGRPAFGYRAYNRQLEVVPEEAAAVREMFRLRGEGMTLMDIAKKLNSEGFTNRSGGRFNFGMIQKILNNERLYRGEYKYGTDEWIPGHHEPILKEDGEC